ncbi:Mitochondrial import inner membrane translocase subunit tim23 [Zancudomyces culisetae]|uniref:Mitochondrial import inner membrane translocase subunit tim23 n=1 Tax=Zancudomyces culisetae TaxID=1213189 RepID=A0A1R1PBV2_ZANCU|nr:Mitochondrial import inner membrane translocase subunit tim23 [Zancudomyces culisetae]|eukprot:OMH78433.1 Mitochondrial import inner membrane translocase subunit tim23 [Zancudomyces culisetae]
MSIFNPYTRTNYHQNEREVENVDIAFLTDQEAEERAKKALSEQLAEKGQSINEQVSSGVGDFLSQVDLGEVYSKLTPLGAGIEYLSLEDNNGAATGSGLPSRSWSDDLCYGAGTAYLAGLGTGGLWGLLEGNRLPAKNFKIRLNGILNAMTRRGPFVGNSAGVLAMYYNGLYAMIGAYTGNKGGYSTSLYAAATTGLVFRATKGLKSAAKASIAFCGVMAAYKFATNYNEILDSYKAKSENVNPKMTA